MQAHNGEIVEKIVRRSGMSLSEVARKAKVNRRSIYNWFQQPRLNVEIIKKIGCILNHDFSSEFPEYSLLKRSHEYDAKPEPDLSYWKNKYIDLLEKYNKLLDTRTYKRKAIDAA